MLHYTNITHVASIQIQADRPIVIIRPITYRNPHYIRTLGIFSKKSLTFKLRLENATFALDIQRAVISF